MHVRSFVSVAVSSLVLGLSLFGCVASQPSDHGNPPPPPPPKPLQAIQGVPELEDINPDPNVVEVNLTASATQWELTPGHMTDVFAYNGLLPGPLLHARVGNRIVVHFQNDLAEPTTIHWHGLRIDPSMDGNPMVVAPIPPGGSFTYDFVAPDPGTFWYHTHVNTISQIPKGLYAPIVIEEAEAPVFNAERMLVIADTRLNTSFQLDKEDGMDMMMGRYGDQLVTNGSTKPATGTIARGAVERWRIVNVAPARTMELGVKGASFRVIGTDGGLLPTPYTTDRLQITVGQRFDLEVTANDPTATEVDLVGYFLNQSNTYDEVPFAQYQVDGDATPATPSYPTVTIPPIPEAFNEQKLILSDLQKPNGDVVMTINGMDGRELPMAEFAQNQPVRFTIENKMMHDHPFHFHGQFFQILSRNGKPVNEPGLKDVVLVEGHGSATITTNFENLGEWMYHCHIAEHAEQGMMAELNVSAP